MFKITCKKNEPVEVSQQASVRTSAASFQKIDQFLDDNRRFRARGVTVRMEPAVGADHHLLVHCDRDIGLVPACNFGGVSEDAKHRLGVRHPTRIGGHHEHPACHVGHLLTGDRLVRREMPCGPPFGNAGLHRLAVAIAMEAIGQGLPVYFVSLAQLVGDLRKAYEVNRLDKRMRVYLRPRLLIVDEVGYLPLDPLAANLFFQLVSARYEKGSMILTSNKSIGEWGELMGDPVLATAVLDRLVTAKIKLTRNTK